MPRIEPLDRRRHPGGVEPGRVHQPVGAKAHRLGSADLEQESAGARLGAHERAAQRDRRAVRLGIGEEREHETVRVHDAGGRRMQGHGRAQAGLEPCDRRGAEVAQIVDAVALGAQAQLFERAFPPGAGGDDELAAAPCSTPREAQNS